MPPATIINGQSTDFPTSGLAYIDLNLIRASDLALREVQQDSDPFKELVNAIRDQGVINPINVRYRVNDVEGNPINDGKKYEIIEGRHRFMASTAVGSGVLDSPGIIPAQIVPRDDAEVMLAQVIGNAHRIETKPADYAKTLGKILVNNPSWTVTQLSGQLNKSPAWITDQLKLNRLNEEAGKLVNEGAITVSNGIVLSVLPKDEQLSWLQQAQTESTTAFATKVNARSKEIKAANRAGREAVEEKFIPTAHYRKRTETESELANPKVASVLVKDVLASTDDSAEVAKLSFLEGVKWVLSLDTPTLQSAEAAWAADRDKRAADKVRRDAEKAKTRAAEAQAKTDAAIKASEEAEKKAAGLPAESNPFTKQPVGA